MLWCDGPPQNMNLMWGEMTDINREEYKQFFLAYHDTVAKSGFTGHRIKPVSVLPQSLLAGFEVAVLSKVAQNNYRIMPTFSSNIKMIIMDLLPSYLVQSFIMRRSEPVSSTVSLPNPRYVLFPDTPSPSLPCHSNTKTTSPQSTCDWGATAGLLCTK